MNLRQPSQPENQRSVFTAAVEKGTKRIQLKLSAARKVLTKVVGRTYYSLPLGRTKDPRRRLTTFRDHCTVVEKFPGLATSTHGWYLPIRPAQTVARSLPITLTQAESSKFIAGIMKHQRGISAEIPEIFICGIPNAEIIGMNAIVRSADRKIFLESALRSVEILEESGLLDAIREKKPVQKCGTYCMLVSPWSSFAYYHWLMEALPRLSLIEPFSALRDVPLIVPANLTRYHRETLELAGVAESRWAKFDQRPWRVDLLIYPEVLGMYGTPSAEVIGWLRKRFLQRNRCPRNGRRKIYISRRDAMRDVTNEHQITDFLRLKGFEVITPGALSFRQQVEMFSQVDTVIGPHGAGFANAVFAPPGATIIELFGDNYVNGCFWALANSCGHRHAAIIQQSANLDFKIPVEKVEAMLNHLNI